MFIYTSDKLGVACKIPSPPRSWRREPSFQAATVMACQEDGSFVTRWAASMNAWPHVATGSLEECYSLCSSGAWPGCVGFTRLTRSDEDEDYEGNKCWWTSNASSFNNDDHNRNEHLYIYQPPSSNAFRCEATRGNSAYRKVPDAGMSTDRPYYKEERMTLQTCQELCSSGAWAGCIGFSRGSGTADSARSDCYWTTQIGWPFAWRDANNNENLWVLNVPPARCTASCEECETLTGLASCTSPSPPPPPLGPPPMPPPPAPPGYCANTCNSFIPGALEGRCDDGVENDGKGLCAPGRYSHTW